MKNKIQTKRDREKKLLSEMILLYCKRKHGKNCLCEECRKLDEYAKLKSDRCPFMENKTFCSNCKTHCYKPQMREEIRKVMKFSGPRMIFKHPFVVLRHILETKRERKRIRKNET